MEKEKLAAMLEDKEKYLEHLKAEMYGTIGQIQMLKDLLKPKVNKPDEGK